MKLETFFNKFDEFAETPNAMPRMRRFILDLAVQGKLVAQDPNDEPAHELLKRVRAEKARLVKSGEIKKQEQLPPVAEDAIQFSLPAGWAVSQLGDVAVCLDYMREPINGTERDLRIAGKAQSELFPYYGATQQQGWIDDFIFDGELVLLGEDGVPFFDDLRQKAYLISGKTWVNNHAHVFRGILISNPFVMH
jgi:type I restriction enzyme S subunit